MLAGQVGHTFAAAVIDTDDHGARIQLRDSAVLAHLAIRDATPGDDVTVRLVAADPVKRQVAFEPSSPRP